MKAVADRLHRWWSGEPVAADTADSLPLDPETYSPILTQLLASDLAKDDAFAAEVQALTDQIGPNVHVVQKIEVANGVTGADVERLVTGTVRVDQGITDAQDVTGFRAKEVGGGDRRGRAFRRCAGPRLR